MRAGPAALAALGLCACVALTRPAPHLTPVAVERGRALGFDEPALARGRELFVSRCVRCHALPDPDAYSGAQWEKTLPRMAHRARLDAAGSGDVRAFVLAVREGARH